MAITIGQKDARRIRMEYDVASDDQVNKIFKQEIEQLLERLEIQTK